MSRPKPGPTPEAEAEAQEYRRLEREWQNSVGKGLLDVPWGQKGAALVFERQFNRIAECLDLASPGVIVEIGCGKGHLLSWLHKAASPEGPRLVGIDVSEAIAGVKQRGLLGLRGDGEFLPLRDESVRTIVYDGALHHLIEHLGCVGLAHALLRDVVGVELQVRPLAVQDLDPELLRLVVGLRDLVDVEGLQRDLSDWRRVLTQEL